MSASVRLRRSSSATALRNSACAARSRVRARRPPVPATRAGGVVLPGCGWCAIRIGQATLSWFIASASGASSCGIEFGEIGEEACSSAKRCICTSKLDARSSRGGASATTRCRARRRRRRPAGRASWRWAPQLRIQRAPSASARAGASPTCSGTRRVGVRVVVQHAVDALHAGVESTGVTARRASRPGVDVERAVAASRHADRWHRRLARGDRRAPFRSHACAASRTRCAGIRPRASRRRRRRRSARSRAGARRRRRAAALVGRRAVDIGDVGASGAARLGKHGLGSDAWRRSSGSAAIRRPRASSTRIAAKAG